jgi:VIT1/CCC1 family predicted Fe2+/Mn2+ transporter
MVPIPHNRDLEAEHQPAAIRQRLAAGQQPSYLAAAVLGAIDGCVTTFAIVAGAVGGGFAPVVIIVLGFANLLADGFSMAASNYLSLQSQREQVEAARRREEQHIATIPAGEREEIRQIFAGKGFAGPVLATIVDTITGNRRLWVETMLTEELGLPPHSPSPLRSGLATFLAFVLIGLVPLVPFVLPGLAPATAFAGSAVATALAFFAVGVAKGQVLQRPRLRSGVETLLLGGTAATLAYLIGIWLRTLAYASL